MNPLNNGYEYDGMEAAKMRMEREESDRMDKLGETMFKVTELGAWSGPSDGRREAGRNKVYTVKGPEEVKSATIKSAVESCRDLGMTISMGDIIVEAVK